MSNWIKSKCSFSCTKISDSSLDIEKNHLFKYPNTYNVIFGAIKVNGSGDVFGGYLGTDIEEKPGVVISLPYLESLLKYKLSCFVESNLEYVATEIYYFIPATKVTEEDKEYNKKKFDRIVYEKHKGSIFVVSEGIHITAFPANNSSVLRGTLMFFKGQTGTTDDRVQTANVVLGVLTLHDEIFSMSSRFEDYRTKLKEHVSDKLTKALNSIGYTFVGFTFE